jgi:hypothetical protein
MLAQQATEPVTGQPAEEHGVDTEAAEPDGDVHRRPAGAGGVVVPDRYQVDERLAENDDHGVAPSR